MGELRGVGEQIEHDLAQPAAVFDDPAQVQVDVGADLQSFGAGLFRPELGGALQDARQVDHGLFDRELPGLHLREVKDVVDQRPHGFAGAVDQLDLLLQAGIQGPVREQDLGHAENAVQGRANLVAGGRQEVGLGLKRLLQRAVRVGQLDVGRPHLVAAAPDRQEAGRQQGQHQT